MSVINSIPIADLQIRKSCHLIQQNKLFVRIQSPIYAGAVDAEYRLIDS